MKEKIALITDTVGNLPKQYLDDNNIYLVRLYVVIDDKYLKDGIDINPDDLHELNESSPNFTSKSSAPSPGDFSEVYEQIKNDGYEKAIYIGMGAQLSTSISNAKLADNHGLELAIIDSKTVTILEGFLVMYANDLIKEGKSFEEVVANVERVVGNSKAYGWFDTLKYLKAGGRLGKAATKVSTVLNLKPVLSVDGDGEFDIYKLKCSREKSYPDIEKRIRDDLKNAKTYYMAYLYGNDIRLLDHIKSELVDIEKEAKEVIEVQFGSVVSVHVGTKEYTVAYLIVD